MKNEPKNMQLENEIDINLYCLWYMLSEFERNSYPNEIKEKIKELFFSIDSFLFKPIPSGYDVTDEKCFIVTTLEKYIPKEIDKLS